MPDGRNGVPRSQESRENNIDQNLDHMKCRTRTFAS